jgi:methionyl-tRNA formyltransferase
MPQDDSQATYTKLLQKSDGAIDWGMPAAQIERMTRAYDPWPGATTTWRGQPLKIVSARAHPEWAGAEQPGALLDYQGGAWVATGAGALELLAVQPAGKRAMEAPAWRRGIQQLQEGERLGE